MVCSVKFSMCSMKRTCSDSGAFSGACAVCNVYYAVCRVQCAACQRWWLSSWNMKFQINMLSWEIIFQKLLDLVYFLKSWFETVCFLNQKWEEKNFNFKNLNLISELFGITPLSRCRMSEGNIERVKSKYSIFYNDILYYTHYCVLYTHYLLLYLTLLLHYVLLYCTILYTLMQVQPYTGTECSRQQTVSNVIMTS